jgi:hypothetical protein
MSPRSPFSFEEAVWRELDQLRQASERQNELLARAIERFGAECDDLKDQVSQVKISVAELRRDPPPSRRSKSGLARDGGLTISSATVGGLLVALAQWLSRPPPAPAMPAPVAISAQASPAPTAGR